MLDEEILKYNIDSRNKELWNELSTKYKIFLSESFEPNYLLNIRGKIITIYVESGNLSPASFAHELLHIELKFKYKMQIGKKLSRCISKSKKLNYIFSNDLEDYICNALEHIKIFNRFINLGYSKEEFLSDFNSIKMTESEIQDLKYGLNSIGSIDRNYLDLYIGKFFSMKSCLNSKFNYDRFYSDFAQIEPSLFRILSSFWENWIDYDPYISKNKYSKILNPFIKELKIWAKNKNIQ